MTEVQKVVFPGEECGEPEMYFRGVPPSAVDARAGKVRVRGGETLTLDTYFNSFPAGKWRRYTRICGLGFRFRAEYAGGGAGGAGRCSVRIIHAVAEADGKAVSRLRRGEEFRPGTAGTSRRILGLISVREEDAGFEEEVRPAGDGRAEVHTCRIKGIPADGILYAAVTPGAGAEIGGMAWLAEAGGGPGRVRLAVGICTFRREEAVTRTVRRLEDAAEAARPARGAAPAGGDAPPGGGPWEGLGIYVADNGGTLRPGAFRSGRVRLLPGPNLGGSAGFARVILEAAFRDREEGFTHIILMDDDVLLPAHVLERTHAFLSLLKDEYAGSMLGGALLHEDRRYYQHESGALFDGTRHFRAAGRFHDMRRREFVALNANPARVNYQGWWYCCVPAAAARRLGLPLPLFLHFDDIEYGLRNSGHELILLNGVCVWHPQLRNKDPVWAAYYNVRNYLIISALYGYTGRACACWQVARLFLWYVLSYRYEEARLLRRAADDFAKGAGHFIAQDAAALHAEILTCGYRRRTPGELGLGEGISAAHECPAGVAAGSLRQLLCALLPPGRRTEACDAASCSYIFGAGRCYVYDRASGDGILYERSPRRFLSESLAFLGSALRLLLGFGRSRKSFREKMGLLTGVPFWEGYLGLRGK